MTSEVRYHFFSISSSCQLRVKARSNNSIGTVQKQFTSGPLQIIRWANIINCHIFPGPAIIRALSEAAGDAVGALNTAVTTSISASPAASYMEDSDDIDSAQSQIDDEVDQVVPDDAQDTEEEDEEEEDVDKAYALFDSGRKPSVVSVSTTISTKTESISPQPSPSHPYSATFHEIHRYVHEDPTAGALARLGQPPFLRSLLILAEMSSAGNLMTGSYTEQCVIEARKFPHFVMGFIAQRSLNETPEDNFVTMTPGVQIGSTGDGLGQQYNTPEKVIQEAGTDVIIVGRGIYGAQDRRAMAEEYKRRGWEAYEARLSPSAQIGSR